MILLDCEEEEWFNLRELYMGSLASISGVG